MSMVEKVETALWNALASQDRARPRTGDLIGGEVDMMLVARAVLGALKEPSDEMIQAGEKAAWDDANHMPAVKAIPAAWPAMIDAALAEPD